MMLPLFWADITRSSCFKLSRTPRTLVSKVAAYDSADCAVIGPVFPSVPALLTATSRRPNRSTVRSTRFLTSSSFRTSARMNPASAPRSSSSATKVLPLSSCLPETIMFAPSRAKARAVARPMPVSAPVISIMRVFIELTFEPMRVEDLSRRSFLRRPPRMRQ